MKNEAAQRFSTGLEHQRAGRLAEARQCYETGLKLDPGQPDALYLLGQLLFETGQAPDGERLMREALRINPNAGHYWNGLAIQLFNAGRFPEARPAFEHAVRCVPGDPGARKGLAMTLEQLGENAAAIDVWRQLRRDEADSSETLSALACLLVAEGRDAEALAVVQDWIALAPANAAAHALRADLHERLGDPDKALADRLEAARCAPDDALLRGQLGLALMSVGLIDAALEQFDESVRLSPENAQLHFNRGVGYAKAGRWEVACQAYQNALQRSPDSPPTLTNLANQYANLERRAEALPLYERALALDPDYAPAHFNLGMLHLDEGRRLEATAALERAATLEPGNGLVAAHLLFQKMHLCRWDGLEALSLRVQQALAHNTADIPPFIVLSMPGTTAGIQRRAAENHSAWLTNPMAASAAKHVDKTAAVNQLPARPSRNAYSRVGSERLRVGYLSADFKNHATSYLLIEMLEAHDRSRFEVFGLSYGSNDRSALRQRVEAGVEHFVELAGLDSGDAVARIAALDLDVLIDIKGYTEGNHSDWLQYRLAPIQINWLGYPGTLGAPWVDYLIADAVVAPMSHQAMFSERLLHLPGSYQPCCRVRDCAVVPTRAAVGLPEKALVLCSFNQTYKITPAMFTLWLEVLKEIPQAVLWLWASNPWAEIELRKAAVLAGVAAERLVFAEGRPQAEHLARLALADLSLDTYPCNGHTTTSDALWAGVPVVTLQGDAFAARVAAGLLAANGLSELIASTPDTYRQLVLDLCRDPARRAQVQAKARSMRAASDFFDGVAFAHKFERLLLTIAAETAGA